MCGIVAMYRGGLSEKEFKEQFLRLMREASIRGLHATGVSYVLDRKVITLSDGSPESNFAYPPALWSSGAVIGHLRYSTSDLAYNQPISVDQSVAIAHNGVVTQAEPSEWPALFGGGYSTKNDSEILLRLYKTGVHPLRLVDTSQAVVLLTPNALRFWRNECRPAHWARSDNGAVVVASTSDILRRALVGCYDVSRCEPCVDYRVDLTNGEIQQELIREPNEDLQP